MYEKFRHPYLCSAPVLGFDYHWYRLDNTGRWSHKPGQTRATNLDNSKRPINDPRRADLGTYEFVCFMKTNRFTVNII